MFLDFSKHMKIWWTWNLVEVFSTSITIYMLTLFFTMLYNWRLLVAPLCKTKINVPRIWVCIYRRSPSTPYSFFKWATVSFSLILVKNNIEMHLGKKKMQKCISRWVFSLIHFGFLFYSKTYQNFSCTSLIPPNSQFLMFKIFYSIQFMCFINYFLTFIQSSASTTQVKIY